MIPKASFREIPFGSEAYSMACELRQMVLRKPLGMDLYQEDLSSESAQLHFGLFSDDSILACAIAVPISATEVKLRQMAVHAEYHGLGLGHQLLNRVEASLIERKFTKIQLHARLTAKGFYLKSGYEALGNEFEEIGLPHIKMQKNLGPKETADRES